MAWEPGAALNDGTVHGFYCKSKTAQVLSLKIIRYKIFGLAVIRIFFSSVTH